MVRLPDFSNNCEGGFESVTSIKGSRFTPPPSSLPSPRGQLFELAGDLAWTKNLANKQPDKSKELAEIFRKEREVGRTR